MVRVVNHAKDDKMGTDSVRVLPQCDWVVRYMLAFAMNPRHSGLGDSGGGKLVSFRLPNLPLDQGEK